MNFTERLNEFDTKANNLQQRLEIEDRNSINNSVLYHFRSAKSALSIIRNRELWFADYKYLKRVHDNEELDLGFSKILEYMVTKSRYEGDFWFKLGGNFLKLKECLSVYVLSCFNGYQEEKMWKQYGEIALGFNFQNKHEEVESFSTYYLARVIYDQDEFKERITAFLNLASEYVDGLNSEEDKAFGTALASHLLVYIPMLKKENFAWEKEYRLVMPGFYTPKGQRTPWDLPLSNLRTVLKEYTHTHFVQSFEAHELKEMLLSDKVKCNLSVYYQDC